MSPVSVITDSIACLTPEIVEQYRMLILPINLYVDGKVYKDGVDMTPTEAYQMFQWNPKEFKSSAPSPHDCLETYRAASKRASQILVVTVSARLSMVYESAQVAREQAKQELPGIVIEVMDSRTATAAEGMVALAGARAAAAGKELAEVVKAAEIVRDKVKSIIFLETIRHAYRSGRVPKVAAQAGSMLNLKPLLTVSGTVNFMGVVRSKERGTQRLFKIMRDKVGPNAVHVAVMHAYAQDEAVKLKERIAAEFNCCELWLSEFSPVMGYACGTGTLGVAFYTGD